MKKMLPVEIWTIVQTEEGNAVLLRPLEKNLTIPIFVGQNEIHSIIIGSNGLSFSRPLTHDLFLKLLDSQNLILDHVEIHDLKDNIFYARLVITGEKYKDDNQLILDSRPSDAIGLATRKKCPIMVTVEIIKKTGISTDLFLDILNNSDSSIDDTDIDDNELNASKKEKRYKLMKQLNTAVEKEEYERAAEIRDALKKFDEERF